MMLYFEPFTGVVSGPYVGVSMQPAGVGGTKLQSSILLISLLRIIETLVTYRISCSYLTGAVATPVKYEHDLKNLTWNSVM